MEIKSHLKWIGPAPGYTLDDYRYGDKGPWPKINNIMPELPAAINNVPKDNLEDFRVNVVSHYIKTLKIKRIKIIFKMLAGDYKLKPVNDNNFSHHIFFGLFSKLLTPISSKNDFIYFSDFIDKNNLLDENGEPRYLKVDTLSMNKTINLPGVYSAPTVTLFKRINKTIGVPLAMIINGLILTPKDGYSWELAKYFALQGILTVSTLAQHSKLHFPMDAISAISLTSLPTQHLLYKLLTPHTRIQLAINQAVLFIPYSVSYNNPFLPYTALPGWGNIPILQENMGWPGQLKDTFCGIEGNENYPKYKYPMSPEKNWTDFEDFLVNYYSVIFEFVSKVVRYMSASDPIIAYWSDAIAAWVPGFPNSQEIKQGDNLAKAITSFIWDVTVAHSADHGSINQYQKNILPLRIRVPPPASKTIPKINRNKMVRFSDTLRHRLCFSMYFGPQQNISLLCDTWYEFNHPTLDHLNRVFLQQLAVTDKNLTCRRFVELKNISRSIDF
ncbi:hypothetical protein [Yersinia wautersii]|uniref:hypothetical protein n=1 Tax=Yersinia wautersii TaxID=1341643 RepID=UPI00042A33C4|nr:hypothetical protein [Yersinia wautersii]